jgi:hypothetical protein
MPSLVVEEGTTAFPPLCFLDRLVFADGMKDDGARIKLAPAAARA